MEKRKLGEGGFGRSFVVLQTLLRDNRKLAWIFASNNLRGTCKGHVKRKSLQNMR